MQSITSPKVVCGAIVLTVGLCLSVPAALAAEIRSLLGTLCDSLSAAGPLLLYGLPAVSPVTDSLLNAGWTCIQTSTRMVRRLSSPAGGQGPPP